ncbi:hypothetical protein SLS55_010448 [Diplodia seriata]|uniref:DUF4282 domain-containing protein n=1 Tax=Diplodia seriata TaxID=420778 RepID=A0ABR3BYI9_9PEZI
MAEPNPKRSPPPMRRPLLWPGRKYLWFRTLLGLIVLFLGLFKPDVLYYAVGLISGTLYILLVGGLTITLYVLPIPLLLRDLLRLCTDILRLLQRFVLGIVNRHTPQQVRPENSSRLGFFGLLRVSAFALGYYNPALLRFLYERAGAVGLYLIAYSIRYGLRALLVLLVLLALGDLVLILASAFDMHDARLEYVEALIRGQ